MPDRNKVIEALEACVLKDPDDSRNCRHCPRCNYGAFITNSCINGVMADALALLKAQEPVEPKMMEFVDEGLTWEKYEVPTCGVCGALLGDAQFCPMCGRAVKWNG